MTWRDLRRPCLIIGVLCVFGWFCWRLEDNDAIKRKWRSGE